MKRSLTVLMLFVATLSWAQGERVQVLAHAIAKTEGFGASKTNLPTRLHNPGDIRAPRGVQFPGQVGLNKHGYVIFKNDTAGWAALYHQIEKVISGESSHYSVNMTLKQFSRKYATSPVWVRNVARFLQVTPNTTLAEILDLPPVISAPSNPHALDSILGGSNEKVSDSYRFSGSYMRSGLCGS